MAFKEGVKDEDVHIWRAWVQTVKDLDEAVDTGALTPQEAYDKLKNALSGKKTDHDTKGKEK
jgi:hypothetical protein